LKVNIDFILIFYKIK